MIHLGLRTEYSFKKCYGFVEELAQFSESIAVGIADDNVTFGHVRHHKNCLKHNVKPILGVRLMVCDEFIEKKKVFGPIYVFIAKNQLGLKELYHLVKKAYDQFYYHPRISQANLSRVSNNIIVIASNFNVTNRIDYIGINQFTPTGIANWPGIPKVAICYNWYPKIDDRLVYQLHSGAKKMERQTFPQHVMDADEWLNLYSDQEAIDNTYKIADLCENYPMSIAPMIKYPGKLTLRELCVAGAAKRKINLTDPEYRDRLERELKLIDEKDFADYFLVVAQMCRTAKAKMLVGPSRGSSAGSLVCFLIEITEVDPIRFDLLFERFIDVNRSDLPDIDIDFPDAKRKMVIDTLSEVYGEDHVIRIATTATMQPKSALGEFAAEMGIPLYEIDALKDSIIHRSSGDARAMMRIEDTFGTTEVGKDFITKYPEMKIVNRIEGHARHSGVHAAGVIVCTENLSNYGGINSRDGALMMDFKEAESLNLLKIDCLGLRTLAVLESVADQIGMPYRDFYKLPLDDKRTYDIFNSMRLSGIFQFNGNALQYITRQMGVHTFDDICAITALGRPGPIHSGGTNLFIGRRTGAVPIEYLSEHPSVVKHTKATYGVIIYQEQLMSIGREYGRLSWEDVGQIRRAASKSLGEEFFNKFKDKFVSGAIENGAEELEAKHVWDNMVTFGSWGFNKSHAYGYGRISYFTAWCKANYPKEFAVAELNNTRRDDVAIKVLRDMVTNDGIEYIAFDPDLSTEEWSVHDGKLLGGLLTLKGIGAKKARTIIQARKNPSGFTPSMYRIMMNPDSIFNILFPCDHWWGDLFKNYQNYGLTEPPININKIKEPGSYLFIGKMIDKNLRDLNETQSVARRDGKFLTEHTLFLNLILEDDTDSIVVTINRYKYDQFGKHIAETGKVDTDWYLVRGNVKDKWRRIDVTQILNLNTWGSENNIGPNASIKSASHNSLQGP